MVSLAEQVAEKIQEFPVEQQKEVLHYVKPIWKASAKRETISCFRYRAFSRVSKR